MSYAVTTTFVDGDPMDAADVEAELQAARDWVNAIPVADVAAGVVRTVHVVPPLIRGYPQQAMLGELQSIGWADYGIRGPLAGHGDAWGAKPTRILIRPDLVDDGGVHYTGVGKSLYLHSGWTHDIVAHVTGTAWVRSPLTAGYPEYPDGASSTNGDYAGRLSLFLRDRTAGTVTEYVTGRVRLYPQWDNTVLNANFFGCDFHAVYLGNVAGGRKIDLVLGYTPSGDHIDSIYQVDLSEVQFSVEVS